MMTFSRSTMAAAAIAAAICFASPAYAKTCFKKAAEGNALTEGLAKFQVDAALLQAVDWGIYGTWVTGNGTPGYSFGPRSYKCEAAGIGWHCKGSATLCKLD
ncbi:MAG: hypothetical protein ABL897_13600 [Hyphomicrobium sp.]